MSLKTKWSTCSIPMWMLLHVKNVLPIWTPVRSANNIMKSLKTTFDEIAPKKAFRKQPSTKLHRTRRTAWSTAAAVVLCLLSFVLGWNHLFSSTARAGQSTAFSLSDGMMCVQNVVPSKW